MKHTHNRNTTSPTALLRLAGLSLESDGDKRWGNRFGGTVQFLETPRRPAEVGVDRGSVWYLRFDEDGHRGQPVDPAGCERRLLCLWQEDDEEMLRRFVADYGALGLCGGCGGLLNDPPIGPAPLWGSTVVPNGDGSVRFEPAAPQGLAEEALVEKIGHQLCQAKHRGPRERRLGRHTLPVSAGHEPVRAVRMWSFRLWCLTLLVAHLYAVAHTGRSLNAAVAVRRGRRFLPADLLRALSTLGAEVKPEVRSLPDASGVWLAVDNATNHLLRSSGVVELFRASGGRCVRGRAATSALGIAMRQLADVFCVVHASGLQCECCGADVSHVPRRGRRVWCATNPKCRAHKHAAEERERRARVKSDAERREAAMAKDTAPAGRRRAKAPAEGGAKGQPRSQRRSQRDRLR